MRRDLIQYIRFQVFLNYPFDNDFACLEDALHFPVIAAGMLPICAKDLTTPDRPRLDMLVDAISNCHYSIHELSRGKGEGPKNHARMNMPIEMGMALFYALKSQRHEHRCAFFVPTLHDYQKFASDLAGLDPKCHNNDEAAIVVGVYEWLRGVVPSALLNSQPTVDIVARYSEFKQRLKKVSGSTKGGQPSHDERREVMYKFCEELKWWDWRATKAGREEFPEVPISWKGAGATKGGVKQADASRRQHTKARARQADASRRRHTKARARQADASRRP